MKNTKQQIKINETYTVFSAVKISGSALKNFTRNLAEYIETLEIGNDYRHRSFCCKAHVIEPQEYAPKGFELMPCVCLGCGASIEWADLDIELLHSEEERNKLYNTTTRSLVTK